MEQNDEQQLMREAVRWTREQMGQSAGHDWGHIERVVRNAAVLAEEEEADRLVVELAAVTHDVVNLAKDDPRRSKASTLSAERVAQWLDGKLEEERIALIYEAVKCHSFSAGFVPQSLEAQVVSDADNLDAIGAIGIARAFECGGALGRITMSSVDPFCREREPDDSEFGLDHFYTKLLVLGERFYTKSGKQRAKQRISFMKTYLAELAREVGN